MLAAGFGAIAALVKHVDDFRLRWPRRCWHARFADAMLEIISTGYNASFYFKKHRQPQAAEVNTLADAHDYRLSRDGEAWPRSTVINDDWRSKGLAAADCDGTRRAAFASSAIVMLRHA